MANDLAVSYQTKLAQNDADRAASDLDTMFKPQISIEVLDESGKPIGPLEPALPEGEEPPVVPGKYAPRRATEDPMGRLQPEGERSTAGKVATSIAEVVPSMARGVHDAIYNATAFVDPLANWLDENMANLGTYKLEGPQTATGEIVKSVTQFLTGFVPAVKLFKTLGVTGKVANPTLAGAVSDFATRDGHEGRLFDLWRQVGLPDNDFVKFMETDKESPEILERFKNALEGAGLGMAFDGVLWGVRLVHGMVRANKELGGATAELESLKEKYGELTDEAIARHLGDPTKPMIETHIVQPPAIGGKVVKAGETMTNLDPRAVIRKTSRSGKVKGEIDKFATPEDFEVYINFSRIDEPDQVKFLMGKLAEANKGTIDEARRGVITQEETRKMADTLGMTVADLLERRKGQPLNAEEAVAARELWAASSEKLLEAAKKAADPNAGPMDQFVFRRLMAVHSAIQNEVIGARTETARALASWKIPAGGGVEKARAIEQILQASGGPEETKQMARRLAILAREGADAGAIARFVARGWGAKSADIIKEVWVNGLLSSPKTHLVNISSNTGVVLQQVYERAAAGGIRGMVGGEGVKAAESIAMMYGIMGAMKDAFRMAAKSLRTGETGYAFNKIDVTHPNSISAEAFDIASNTTLGKTVDFVGHAAVVPGRLLGAEDEFFKTIGYRAEIHAQAMRQATNEGLIGDAAWKRMIEIVNDPPEHIRINAADAAMYNTFTNQVGPFGKALMSLRDDGSPIAQTAMTLVLPFIRTPTNIARYTFERTPFAPLVGQWRADIAAGGARADLALARMATGTAIMTTAMDWATSGMLSGAGPSDPGEREALTRQGWQPYSILVGDRWYSYNRTDPFGATMGFAASIVESVSRGEIDQEDVDEWQEVLGMSIAAVSQVTINKTYLQGVANVVEVMSDPSRYSERYVNNLVGSFVPFTALSSAVETAVDPTQREAANPWEAVQSRIVGLAEKLPPRRNLWGEEIRSESGLGRFYDFMSPVASKGIIDSPVDREISRLGWGPQRIKKHDTFNGVRVSFKQWPEVYDEYTRLAGNDLKHLAWGVGAKDFLNQVVSGRHPLSGIYEMMSDETRREFISNTVSDYRKMAQQQILNDPQFAKFAKHVEYLKQYKRQSVMPVLGE